MNRELRTRHERAPAGRRAWTRHASGAVLATMILVALGGCGRAPSAAATTASCGEPPGEAVLLASSGPSDTAEAEVAFVIVAEHGQMAVDVTIVSQGEDSSLASNDYVETADWICLLPVDSARIGDEAVARIRAVGQVAVASPGGSSYAEAYAWLNAPSALVSHRVEHDSAEPAIAFDDLMLAAITLGEWFRVTSIVDTTVRADGGATSSAAATLGFAVESVTTQGGQAIAIAATQTASGATY